MTPNPSDMEQFVHLLFGSQLAGKVELAWRDAEVGKLRHAELFGLEALDDLVEKAVEVNAVEGQNVYIGGALRSPDSPPFGRCSDDDVLCATAYWADLDDAAAVSKARKLSGNAPANIACITGRTPHPRAQLWWLQIDAIDDLDLLRRQNAAIAAVLGSDPAVTNPARLMRLPGSIAWPTKPGRVAELTELITWPDRQSVYLDGQVATAFPLGQEASLKVSGLFGSPPERWVELLQEGAGEGQRNNTAAALAGYFFRNNINPKIVHELLRCVNDARFVPPLDDDELLAVLESIAKAELKRRGVAT